MNQFVIAGGFTLDDVEATCVGLGYAVAESQTLPTEEFIKVAKRVMDAIWHQPLPSGEITTWSVDTMNALVNALESGWIFNANEADSLFMVFGDIRPIERDGRIVGVGTRAPDGAFIHDGRELVSWRERRWSAMYGPAHVREKSAKHTLRLV